MCYLIVVVFSVLVLIWKLLRIYSWILEDILYVMQGRNLAAFLLEHQKLDCRPCDRLQELARQTPHKSLILYENHVWTYKQIHSLANKCGRALRRAGISEGDKVGLFMNNEPGYIALWQGCNRVGAVAAFLNTKLRQKSLLHCIDVAEVTLLIVGEDPSLVEALQPIEENLRERNLKLFVYGSENSLCSSFLELVDKEDPCDIPREWRGNTKYSDPICYIFTSGTTGLPKAVNLTSWRAWGSALLLNFCKPTHEDVVYTSLPLYHTSASMVCFCGVLTHGCTMVLRKKFSASHFWSDCRKYNVTIAQYIGEMIRYLCKQPETAEDRNHKVRAIIGNGLRPDVWRTFLDRYGAGIRVVEFYAATEGNAAFVNMFNKFGCVGTFTPLMQRLSTAALVKFDPVTETVVKDKKGRAIRASTNEPGLLVGKITKASQFCTYKGQDSLTEKKILKNLFKDGDKYYNMGDVLVVNEKYEVSFCDRVGDTFRWKGENVSTNEVSDTIVQAPGVKESNVYGVEVPGQEGRAGMAALVLESSDFDWKKLYVHVCDNLPSYARPIFVRVTDTLELTGTLKQRKVKLQNEGFDLKKISDKMYFLDQISESYVEFTEEKLRAVEDGTLRL